MAALALVLLWLAAAPAPLAREPRLAAALDLVALDVAFLDARRLAVLSDESLSLYAIEGARLVLTARLALPGEHVRARAAAAQLRLVPGEEACWAISSRRSGATLFTWSGGRLAAIGGAEAIPPTVLPSGTSPEGARFEAGTNRIRLGASVVLRLASSRLSVAADGALLVGGEPEPGGRRIGDALADIGDGRVAASSPAPPSGQDEIHVFSLADPSAPALATWPVAGRLRAIAAWSGPGARLLAVAADTPDGPSLRVDALLGDDP